MGRPPRRSELNRDDAAPRNGDRHVLGVEQNLDDVPTLRVDARDSRPAELRRVLRARTNAASDLEESLTWRSGDGVGRGRGYFEPPSTDVSLDVSRIVDYVVTEARRGEAC